MTRGTFDRHVDQLRGERSFFNRFEYLAQVRLLVGGRRVQIPLEVLRVELFGGEKPRGGQGQKRQKPPADEAAARERKNGHRISLQKMVCSFH